MAQLGTFNPEEHKDSFGTLPAGQYVLAVTKGEMKTTKAGDGQYLELQNTVQEGEYQGRIIFTRLNLRSNNMQAKKIAETELANLCRACGKGVIKDSDELLAIPFIADVAVEKGKEKSPGSGDFYNDQNRIAKYMPKTEAVASPAAPTSGPWGN